MKYLAPKYRNLQERLDLGSLDDGRVRWWRGYWCWWWCWWCWCCWWPCDVTVGPGPLLESERERDGTRCWDKLSPQVRTGDILKSLFSGNWPISWSWSKTRVIIIKLPPVWQDAISCCNLIRWLLGIEVKPSDHFIYLVQSARDPGLASCCSEHCWEMLEMGHSHRTVKTFCLENDT